MSCIPILSKTAAPHQPQATFSTTCYIKKIYDNNLLYFQNLSQLKHHHQKFNVVNTTCGVFLSSLNFTLTCVALNVDNRVLRSSLLKTSAPQLGIEDYIT